MLNRTGGSEMIPFDTAAGLLSESNDQQSNADKYPTEIKWLYAGGILFQQEINRLGLRPSEYCTEYYDDITGVDKIQIIAKQEVN